MNPRDTFLSWCAQYGLDQYETSVADTLAHFESSYNPYAWNQFEDAKGLFQIRTQWSPMKNRRLSGEFFGVADQFREYVAFAQGYNKPDDLWLRFKRHNGSGDAAEAYANRAIAYWEANWGSLFQDSWDLAEAGLPWPRPPVESPAATGRNLSLPLLGLCLVGLVLSN